MVARLPLFCQDIFGASIQWMLDGLSEGRSQSGRYNVVATLDNLTVTAVAGEIVARVSTLIDKEKRWP